MDAGRLTLIFSLNDRLRFPTNVYLQQNRRLKHSYVSKPVHRTKGGLCLNLYFRKDRRAI